MTQVYVEVAEIAAKVPLLAPIFLYDPPGPGRYVAISFTRGVGSSIWTTKTR